ncbi:MAG TPA: peptide ABC transporter substrate-binding protein [bacterium]|nr:peptide ABC transporter substrate-binding protein [bacterium]
MATREARGILARGGSGRLSRREVISRLAAAGLGSTAIASALSAAGLRPARAAAPAKRGGSGLLKLLYWQAPTILNAHLAVGVKDAHASHVCTEPLLTVDEAGVFRPVLAASVPTRANGGLSADGKTVTYTLKRGVRWADGRPFTADDVVFTFQFVNHKETGAISYAYYQDVERVEPLDPYTVKITFKHPTPAWYLPFVGSNGQILPQHALDAYIGSNSRNAPFNTKSFGTGPYKVETFRPGDLVVYSINEYYRDPAKPVFDQVQIKGGGDAVSAARAVLETGEYDYAWNLQVEWPVLQQMAQGAKGAILAVGGGGVEQIYCNQSDPTKEVDGQRSSLRGPHPFLTDAKVRQAMSLGIDRETIAKQLYGQTGESTANVLTTPTRVNSKDTKVIFDLAKANQLLDEAGWQRGSDGVRQKNGVKLELTYATSVNSLRQKEQEVVKAGWEKLGIRVTLKAVDAAVYFGSMPGNNDTLSHFYTDTEMHTATFGSPFPATYMARFYSGDPAKDIPQKENNWSGQNICRWVNKDYNQLYEKGLVELDPKKNDELWIKMNDLVVGQGVSLPIIDRKDVSARAKTLDVGPNMTPFDSQTWNIADWRRVG